MNKARQKARDTRFANHVKNNDLTPTYEKQALKKKSGFNIDDKKRID